jgi:hypothetical protein
MIKRADVRPSCPLFTPWWERLITDRMVLWKRHHDQSHHFSFPFELLISGNPLGIIPLTCILCIRYHFRELLAGEVKNIAHN